MLGFGNVRFTGWKSNIAIIVEIKTYHENKKLQLQSKPAAGLGRGLRTHKIPGELRLGETLQVSSHLLRACWAYSSLTPHFSSRGWPRCTCCSRCSWCVPGRGSRHRPPPADHTARAAVPVLAAAVHSSSRFACCRWHPRAFAAVLLSSESVPSLYRARGPSIPPPGLSTCPCWTS